MAYPTRSKAVSLWYDCIEYRRRVSPNPKEKEFIFHTQGVAWAAEKLASKIQEMNKDKAYVLGLLHDCGKKVNEFETGHFHGREGYEFLNSLGYDEAAKICLTHSFKNKDFDVNESLYPKPWMEWAHDKIKDIEYDDYDRLIQLCDMFFEGLNVVSIKERIAGITSRYNADKDVMSKTYKEAVALKNYFDKKINCDVYDLLGIKE